MSSEPCNILADKFHVEVAGGNLSDIGYATWHLPVSADLQQDPFQHCLLETLIDDAKFLKELKQELLSLDFVDKNNDLYQFSQSKDLKTVDTPQIQKLKQFLCVEFLNWLRNVTGLNLTSQVDITSSKYEYTDILLCHDDRLESRRIAYVFYLGDEQWDSTDGGMLNLFACGADCLQPTTVAKSLLPTYNSMVLFEVSPKSFHEVSEVVTTGKLRLSINGWFHAAVPKEHDVTRLPHLISCVPEPWITVEETLIHDWISTVYLCPEIQEEVRTSFQEDSEVELMDFFKPNKYKELSQVLSSVKIDWKELGPANIQRTLVADERQTLPKVVSDVLSLFRSEAMFLILSQLTGIEFHPLFAKEIQKSGLKECQQEEQGSQHSPKLAKRVPSAPGFADGCSSSAATASTVSHEPELSKSDFEEVETKRLKLSGEDEQNSNEKVPVEDQGDSDQEAHSNEVHNTTDRGGGDARETISGETKSQDSCQQAICSGHLGKWSPGSYTLLSDASTTHMCLDARYFVCPDGWSLECGGYSCYVAKGEDEELLTVLPQANRLALVFRDLETLRFVKYVNDRSRKTELGAFCDFDFTYCEA